MFNQTFYHGLIRKYVTLIGYLFDGITIEKTDDNGDIISVDKVRVTYAPKDKMLARVKLDPKLDIPSAATLPMPFISFEIKDFAYDESRKLNTLNRVSRRDSTDSSKLKYQYQPVPYNIYFKAYAYGKNFEDVNKIVETVLPYFTPQWTTQVVLIEEMNEIVDIPVVMSRVGYSDNYDDEFKQRRAIIYELDLTLKGYFYGPVKSSGIIKFVNVNFYIPSVPDGELDTAVGETAIAEKMTIQPGLTEDGLPTSDINETIPYIEIDINDDYGYITQIYTEEDLL